MSDAAAAAVAAVIWFLGGIAFAGCVLVSVHLSLWWLDRRKPDTLTDNEPFDGLGAGP